MPVLARNSLTISANTGLFEYAIRWSASRKMNG
jgi:hypothetical protein